MKLLVAKWLMSGVSASQLRICIKVGLTLKPEHFPSISGPESNKVTWMDGHREPEMLLCQANHLGKCLRWAVILALFG